MRINQIKKLHELGKTVAYSLESRYPSQVGTYEADILAVDVEANMVQIEWRPSDYDGRITDLTPETVWVQPTSIKCSWEELAPLDRDKARDRRAQADKERENVKKREKEREQLRKKQEQVKQNHDELKAKLEAALGVEPKWFYVEHWGGADFSVRFTIEDLQGLLKHLGISHTLQYFECIKRGSGTVDVTENVKKKKLG